MIRGLDMEDHGHGGSWNRIGFAITHTFIVYRACLRFSQRGTDKADHD